MRLRTVAVALAAMILITAPLAQGTVRGKFRGTVTDAEGDPIVGMNVTAINQTNPDQLFTQKTNRKGRFAMMLDPLPHKFVFELEGYRDYETVIKVRATTQEIPFEIMSEEQYNNAVATVLAKTPTPPEVEANQKYNEALELFQKGMKAKDGSEKRIEVLQEATGLIREILTALPTLDPSKVEQLPTVEGCNYLLGNICWQLNDKDCADQSFAEVTRVNPERSEPYYYRGELAAQRAEAAEAAGDLQTKQVENAKAVDLWDQYLKLEPEDESIVYNLAVLAFQSKKYEIAAENLRRTIKLQPEHANANWLLGHTLIKLMNHGEARSPFEKYLELQPEGAHAQDVRELLTVLP